MSIKIDRQKLKKKMTDFAGFIEKGNAYIWPDGRFDFAPNFLDSLDACIKWLIPKLSYWSVSPSGNPNEYLGWARTTTSKECYAAASHNASLALCLAIEKLIDREVKKWIEIPTTISK